MVAKDAIATEVTYPQIYATPDGETHFRDVSVALTSEAVAPPLQPFAQSELQAATTIRHAVFPAGWGVYDRDHGVFHNPTSARFVTVRRGVGWIKTSDGETRRVQAGDVVQVLDKAPSKGHIFWVGDEPMILYVLEPPLIESAGQHALHEAAHIVHDRPLVNASVSRRGFDRRGYA